MPSNLDIYGIAKLVPTTAGGREWYATWDNGHARTINSVNTDPFDGSFRLRGNGMVVIDGHGIARLQGASPRMYVYSDGLTWKNVEVTFYAMRISETQSVSSQGLVCGARSEHQAADVDPCKARTYYGRLLYDGRVHFAKEIKHVYATGTTFYAENRPDDSSRVGWQTDQGRMPTLQWIGFKYFVRNLAGDSHVQLSLYMDLSMGANGGAWQKMTEIMDTGDWRRDDVADCGHPANQVWSDAASSVFVRNDQLIAADYMKFSIREIEPL